MSKLTELALASYEFEKQAQDTTGKKIARVAGAAAGVGAGGVVGSHVGAAAGITLGSKFPVAGKGFGAKVTGKLGNIVMGGMIGGVAGAGAGAVGGGMLGHKAVKSMQKQAKSFSDITPTSMGTGTVIENGSTMPVKTPVALRPTGGMATGLEGAVKSGLSNKMKLGLAGGALALGAGAMALMHKKKDDGQVKVAADYNWKDLAKSTAGTVGGAAAGGVLGGVIAGPIGASYGVVRGAQVGYHRLGKGMHSNGKPVRTHTEAETHTPAAAVGRVAGVGAGALVGQEVGKHLGRFAGLRMIGKSKVAGSYGYVAGAALGALAGGASANHAMNQHVKEAEENNHPYTAGTALGSFAGMLAGDQVGGRIGMLSGHPMGHSVGRAVGGVAGYLAAKSMQHQRSAKELDTTSAKVARGYGHVTSAIGGAALGGATGHTMHGSPAATAIGAVGGAYLGYRASKAIQDHANHIKAAANKDQGLAKEEKDDIGPFKADAGAEADKSGKGESTKGKSLLIAAAQEQMAKAA